VKGSTAAADRLDPEEWAEIMGGVFGVMTRPVEKFGGTVARLMGDAVLAFFGAPTSHEDDPERAVLAGLEIVEGMTFYSDEVRQRWGIDVAVRVGINTGLVRVGAIGSEVIAEYTAIGDAVNVAARMEQTAEPGTVQITEDTYRLTSQTFEFLDLGELEVKGKALPVKVYRPLRQRSDPGSRRGITGLEANLVGRERELDQLCRAVAHLHRGVGGIIGMIGEAGLGKSRLTARCDGKGVTRSGGIAPRPCPMRRPKRMRRSSGCFDHSSPVRTTLNL
jgi:class 3 adenylate cyclase